MTDQLTGTGQRTGFRPALEAITSRLPGVIYVTDDAGRLIYLSEQIERLIGVGAATLVRLGQPLTRIVHPEDSPAVAEELRRAASLPVGSVPTMEYRLAGRGGSTVWVRDYAIEMVDRGRRMRHGALLDITGERTAEQALASSEAHYMSVLDSANHGIVRLGADGEISFLSQAAHRALGWSPDEVVGQPLGDLVHPVDRGRIATAVQQAWAEAEPNITFRAARPSGGWVWVNAIARATTDSRGRVAGVQMLLREVNSAEQRSEELTAAERMLSTMLEAVDEGFVLQTVDGEILALNKRARELLGPLGAIQDRLPPGWKLLDDGGLPISASSGPTRVVLQTDRPLSGTIEVQRGDGARVWLAVDCRPLHRSGESRPFAALASYADVTATAESAHEHRELEVEKELRVRAEDVAQRLRSIFAPPQPPVTPGVKLASVYIPAADGVSGDWHEAIPLPDGTLGLAIGDVTGHGIDAAAMMGSLRAALHAYALEMHEPHVVLEALNLVLPRAGARMASVLYAILDATEGVVRYARAGHPPMLLIDPGGEVSFLRGGHSPLLGYEYRAQRPQAYASLEPKSTLMMYTDGVLEGGCKSVDDALDQLAARVAQAPSPDPEALCEHLFPNRAETAGEDDAALFVVRLERAGEPELNLQLDADHSQLRVMRHSLERWLATLHPGRDEQFQLLLAADEAARNSVEHAYGLDGGSFAVSARCDDDSITIRVSDAGAWRPRASRRRGRGIPLMRKLVDQMEIHDLAPGTEVVLTRKLQRHGGRDGSRGAS